MLRLAIHTKKTEMFMNQNVVQKFESVCQKAALFIHNDMPLGSIHDFLAQMKSLVLQKKEELAQAEVNKLAAVSAPADPASADAVAAPESVQ